MKLSASWTSGRVRRGVLAANAVGAAAAAVFAGVGLARPGYVQPGSSPDAVTGFWATSSAVRSWAVTVPLLVLIVRGETPPAPLLTVAGLVQLGDAALGVRQRSLPMTVLPAVMGIVHLRTAALVSR